MRRIRLPHINMALYLTLVALVFTYRAELVWSASALPALAGGKFPKLIEHTLRSQAKRGVDRTGNPAGARELLKRSLAIDPYSKAAIELAQAYAREGDHQRALEELRRYLEVDPAYLLAYLRAAEIYRSEGRERERRQLLEQGSEIFRSSGPRYRPRTDETVAERYNQKAVSVYEYHRGALRALQSALRSSRTPRRSAR